LSHVGLSRSKHVLEGDVLIGVDGRLVRSEGI